jgi:hypothetical protein
VALVNHIKKEIHAKVVYYGPARSGKGAALTYIYSRIKPSLRGELKSVPAGADNLLLFDFRPFEAPLLSGYYVHLHLYTLSGSVTNPATWKMTLKGADGIMILIDPAADRATENGVSVARLRDFLSAYGVSLHETPAVLQLNSVAQTPVPLDMATIAADLDLATLPKCRTNTTGGEGLLEALATLSRQVIDRITVKNELRPADAAPVSPPSSEKTSDLIRHETSTAPPILHTTAPPKVTVASDSIVTHGNIIRIPLEISHDGTRRSLIVTVNVALE